jgi:hypothetical protein
MPWSEKRLKWSDFKEEKKEGKYRNKLGKTNWSMSLSFGDTTGLTALKKINIKIVALFNPHHSWIKEEKLTLSSLKVLLHEQIHFDLVELYARKLREKISTTVFTKDNYKKRIKKMRKKMLRKLRSVQEDYDLAVKGGNDETLRKWQIKSLDGIAALSNFAPPIFSIILQ